MAKETARILSIEFDQDEQPEYVSVRLPVEVAVFLGVLTGRQNEPKAQELAPNYGPAALTQAYELFSHGLANRFWDGGLLEIDRVLRETHA